MVEENINAELYPIAEQASRIIAYMARTPDAIVEADSIFAAMVGRVSAQQVATVKRVLVQLGYLEEQGFSYRTVASSDSLVRLSVQLEGVADYLGHHKDHDTVRLIITEQDTTVPFARKSIVDLVCHPALPDDRCLHKFGAVCGT